MNFAKNKTEGYSASMDVNCPIFEHNFWLRKGGDYALIISVSLTLSIVCDTK